MTKEKSGKIFFRRYSALAGLTSGYVAAMLSVVQFFAEDDVVQALALLKSTLTAFIAIGALCVFKCRNAEVDFTMGLGLKIAAFTSLTAALILGTGTYALCVLRPDVVPVSNEPWLLLPATSALGLFMQGIFISTIAMVFLRKRKQ